MSGQIDPRVREQMRRFAEEMNGPEIDDEIDRRIDEAEASVVTPEIQAVLDAIVAINNQQPAHEHVAAGERYHRAVAAYLASRQA